jgi:hypothetical protein
MTTHPLALADRPRTTAARRAARHRADDPIHLLGVPARQLRLEVLLWAMRMGVPVDADALTCILLAKQSQVDLPFTCWTAESLRRLLWVDILTLCGSLDRRPPDQVAPTLWTLVDFLDRHDRLDDHSDRLEALRAPLIDSGGLGRRRRSASARRRHPAAR